MQQGAAGQVEVHRELDAWSDWLAVVYHVFDWVRPALRALSITCFHSA